MTPKILLLSFIGSKPLMHVIYIYSSITRGPFAIADPIASPWRYFHEDTIGSEILFASSQITAIWFYKTTMQPSPSRSEASTEKKLGCMIDPLDQSLQNEKKSM